MQILKKDMPRKSKKTKIVVIKEDDGPKDFDLKQPAFPNMPVLYLEFLENKRKVKPELRSEDYVPTFTNESVIPNHDMQQLINEVSSQIRKEEEEFRIDNYPIAMSPPVSPPISPRQESIQFNTKLSQEENKILENTEKPVESIGSETIVPREIPSIKVDVTVDDDYETFKEEEKTYVPKHRPYMARESPPSYIKDSPRNEHINYKSSFEPTSSKRYDFNDSPELSPIRDEHPEERKPSRPKEVDPLDAILSGDVFLDSVKEPYSFSHHTKEPVQQPVQFQQPVQQAQFQQPVQQPVQFQQPVQVQQPVQQQAQVQQRPTHIPSASQILSGGILPPPINGPKHISENPSPQELKEINQREDLLFKFGLLRRYYREVKIPDFDNHTDISVLRVEYERLVRQLKLDEAVENYKKYMTMGFMIMEWAIKNFLNFDEIDGYAANQALSMNKYEKILIQIGEQQTFDPNKQWSPLFNLIFAIGSNTVIFVFHKMCLRGAGNSGLMNNIIGNMADGGKSSSLGGFNPPQKSAKKMNRPSFEGLDLETSSNSKKNN